MADQIPRSFHSESDQLLSAQSSKNGIDKWKWAETEVRTWHEWSLSATFTPHFHPFVQNLLERLISDSITGLQDADTEPKRTADGNIVTLPDGTPRPALYTELFTRDDYQPTGLVAKPYPRSTAT